VRRSASTNRTEVDDRRPQYEVRWTRGSRSSADADADADAALGDRPTTRPAQNIAQRIRHCNNRCGNSNHIITRIRIQTAGLAFGGTGLCSYRVRGIDGSCAEHSSVESYTVNRRSLFANSHTVFIIIGIPSPTHSFIPGLKPSFSANPYHRSLSFSSSGFTTWIPQTVYFLLSIFRLVLFSFSVFYTF